MEFGSRRCAYFKAHIFKTRHQINASSERLSLQWHQRNIIFSLHVTGRDQAISLDKRDVAGEDHGASVVHVPAGI